MPGYIVSGTLGGGKTLVCVARMRDYIKRGRPVATNINLDLGRLLGDFKPTAPIYRLPDRPSSADLEALGAVHDTGREELNGALVLDECGSLFNARDWADKDRQDLVSWFMHSRKFGWDAHFIVQSPNMLDKQLREVFREDYTVRCRRLDRVGIPYLSSIVKALTFGAVKLTLPAMHVGVVVYGHGHSAQIAERWWYPGRDLWGAYDTAQRIGLGEAPGFSCMVHPGTDAERRVLALQRDKVLRVKPKRREVVMAQGIPEAEAVRLLAAHYRRLDALGCSAVSRV